MYLHIYWFLHLNLSKSCAKTEIRLLSQVLLPEGSKCWTFLLYSVTTATHYLLHTGQKQNWCIVYVDKSNEVLCYVRSQKMGSWEQQYGSIQNWREKAYLTILDLQHLESFLPHVSLVLPRCQQSSKLQWPNTSGGLAFVLLPGLADVLVVCF